MNQFIVSFLILLGCQDNMDKSVKIKAKLDGDKLQIENLADEPMYYIVLTDESIAYTDWRPFIKPFSSKIEANSNLKIDATKTDKMKEFIIYFWYPSDDVNDDNVADQTHSVRIAL